MMVAMVCSARPSKIRVTKLDTTKSIEKGVVSILLFFWLKRRDHSKGGEFLT